MNALGIEITPEVQDRYDTVVRHYCTLSALVGSEVYNYEHAADCFCRLGSQPGPITNYWRYDDAVLQFIEDAVVAAVAKKLRLDRKQVRVMLQEKRA